MADEAPAGHSLRRMARRHRGLLIAAAVALVAVGVWAARRSGSPSDPLAAGRTVSGFFLAQETGDCERLADLVSEASWSKGGRSRTEFVEQCEAVTPYDDPQLPVFEFAIVDEDGFPQEEDGRVGVRTFGYSQQDHEGHLVREDGRWTVEIDAFVFRIGPPAEQAVRDYVDAYNEGDCERLIAWLAEVVWSREGQISRREVTESCTTAVDARGPQTPVYVGEIGITEHEARAEGTVGLVGLDGASTGGPEVVQLVQEGLAWKLDSSPVQLPLARQTAYVELEAHLLDQVEAGGDTCFHHTDTPTEEGLGIVRQVSHCGGVTLKLERFTDDASARAEAEVRAADAAGDTSAGTEPGQTVPVPGQSEALGVVSSCRLDFCVETAFGVRNHVLVEVSVRFGHRDLSTAGAVLATQMEQL